jgi:polyhydroxyalkanoate synthesis repressor PhaR
VRIIKKYPNRRLYDTSMSSYITLDGVRQMVLDQEDFQVVDSKSGDDITRTILLQIIGEQESQEGNPLFSNQSLQQLIRFYGDSLQGLMGEYLERSITTFMDQQDMLRKQVQNVMEANPLNIMSEIAKQNLNMWQTFSQSGQKKQDKDED